ncbi:MAG TPA: DUF4097 family beta strand repeat-containing protein [Gemmatimonadaceae bacterium]|nr:DUF4097 family beta strand repeat-containing protein [Gemmatimonadaceae bacterium]
MTTTRAIIFALFAAAPLAQLPAQQPAQQPDFRWEKAIPAGRIVRIHNLNGDVIVAPSTSGKVEVTGARRGRIRNADDVTVEVVETADGLVICSMFRNADMDCDERGMRVHSSGRRDRDDWDDARIDITVRLPKGHELTAGSVSGDVRVTGAEGDVRVSSVSGDVHLDAPKASRVRASSVSGDVEVRIHELTGSGALSFTSVSGNVDVDLPKGVDADVTMRTVSGSMESDFPLTLNGRMSRRSFEARIGKGGRELEVRTVSGDVRLREVK